MQVIRHTLKPTIPTRKAILPRITIPKATPDSAIFTPFLYTFIEHMCPNSEAATYCLDTELIIPPYDEQIQIVNTMRNIYEHVDITGADHAIFKLLLTHELEKLNEILHAIQEYRSLGQHIADLISQ